MITITQYRKKCIGCNYCVEIAPDRWVMSKRDGKCTLLQGKPKKGFYSVKVGEGELERNLKAAEACPVKVIKIRY